PPAHFPHSNRSCSYPLNPCGRGVHDNACYAELGCQGNGHGPEAGRGQHRGPINDDDVTWLRNEERIPLTELTLIALFPPAIRDLARKDIANREGRADHHSARLERRQVAGWHRAHNTELIKRSGHEAGRIGQRFVPLDQGSRRSRDCIADSVRWDGSRRMFHLIPTFPLPALLFSQAIVSYSIAMRTIEHRDGLTSME